MKFGEWLDHANKLAEAHPEVRDMDAVYSKDDEGNGYQHVYYGPELGCFEHGEEFRGFDATASDPEEERAVNKFEDCNAVCLT